MNITVGEYTIRRELTGQVFIHKKGAALSKFIADPPWPHELQHMTYEEAHIKMQFAFETGVWPTDRCPRCGK